MVRIKKSDSSGPWNKIAGSKKDEESSPEKSNEQKKEEDKKEVASRSTGSVVASSYVPPHMRGERGSSVGDSDRRGGSGGRMGRAGRNAPDLNQMNFPSLSDTIGGSKDPPKGVQMDRYVPAYNY